MNKVGKSIGWCDYTINPVKGKCPMACPYCYARRMYDRFKWNPRIRYEAWANSLANIKQPSRIFIGSTMELFGDWIYPQWLASIFNIIKCNPMHTFIFLTKCPQNLIKWSPFPENCWVGVTATNQSSYDAAVYWLHQIQAVVKYISLEPLLEPVHLPNYKDVDWLIIGQQTPISKKTSPKIEDLQEIVEAADKARVPVFLKDNLIPLLASSSDESKAIWAYSDIGLRQEFPTEQ